MFYSFGTSSLAINPSLPSDLIALDGINDIYLSKDFGENWQLVRATYTEEKSYNRDFVVYLSSGIPVVCDGGFGKSFVSSDGGSNWTTWNPPGKASVGLTSLAVDPHNPRHIVGGFFNGLAWTFDGGKTWENEPLLWGTTGIEFAPTNPLRVYAVSNGGDVVTSSDGGITWQAKYYEGVGSYTPPRYGGLSVDPTDEKTIYCPIWAFGFVCVSHDYGQSFKIVSTGGSTYCAESGKTVVYAGTINGILASHDKGASWNPLGLDNLRVESISVSPVLDNLVLAGTTTGIYMSEDGGLNWVAKSKGITEQWVSTILSDPLNPDMAYAESKGGSLFVSYDRGENWTVLDKLSSPSTYMTIFPSSSGERSLFVGDREYALSLTQKKAIIVLQINRPTFTINGVPHTLDSPPIIKSSRTLVPIRAIIEALGGSVGWDGTARKATVTLGSTSLQLWIGKSAATVNGTSTPIDSTNSKVVPEIINGRTMLPLRFVTENLGATVGWEQNTQTITITYTP